MALNQITTIFFDVDGIFTDGSLYFSDSGVNITKFNVHDGMGCILLKEAGIELLILTARHSDAVIKRFKDLGINKIFTKVLKKRDFIKEYSKAHNLEKKELAMMGDDLQDLAADFLANSKSPFFLKEFAFINSFSTDKTGKSRFPNNFNSNYCAKNKPISF